MQIVLMAGGKGKRLWPLSTNNNPKQFVELDETKRTMLSETYKNISNLNLPMYATTQEEYKNIVLSQTSKNVIIITEPFSNNTFAAILNIAVFLREQKNISLEEKIAIVPTDHEVENDFYTILNEASAIMKKTKKKFCLIGVKPNFPSTQYGYIIHNKNEVKKFVEKPNEENAINLIEQNAVWNSGILIFELKTIIDIAKNYCSYNSYDEFVKKYNELPNNSFDYEILEKKRDIAIVLSEKKWKDLGNWNNLYQSISKEDEYNTNIINKEQKEIKNFGVCNSIIINTKDGVALYPKANNNIVRRRWGYYKVLDEYNVSEENVKIKYLKIYSDKNISYQTHRFRDEVWFIINGTGEVVINGKSKKICKGDICTVTKNDKHAIKSLETLEIIEIQKGEKTVETDIERIEFDWKKISNN